MQYEIILFLAIIAYDRSYVQASINAATFGHHFIVLFPNNNQNGSEKPMISVTLMNPNSKEVSIEMKYAESTDNHSIDIRIITVIVQAMNFMEVHFNQSSINNCKNDSFVRLVECSDSRIYITSSQLPISVLLNWYLINAGDSFIVLPSSMATNKYAFAAPAPADDGMTTVYFLPLSDGMTINVVGEIDEVPFNRSFSPKHTNGNLLALQATTHLALVASATSPFTVIVAVAKLIASSDETRTDFGAYMPTPLLDSETIFDPYNVNDYHISMLYTEKFLVTSGDDSLYDSQFTVFNEMESSRICSLTDHYNEVKLEEYSLNAGINSSSIMLQVLRYGGTENELIKGSFLDLIVAWSQFVTGLTTFVVPTDENIVAIIGDTKATSSTMAGHKIPTEIIWNWAPMTFYSQIFYYSTMSLPKGFYVITSDGSYSIFVIGKKNDATYGFVTAYNMQTSKALPEVKTTVQPITTTEMPCKDV
ncbi:hypothetical protein LOAG_05827 [Loa loa]|uniref:IgGFc-binding protein N-terminal domain-containing protein n=2 Tax=Loa loa TaxID=7209 RepID=A0A1S0TZ74_LOALO|nr:hypothetical protein LOAG_05827 [Loa loa]EFO22658.2 hypothetical protein LOAG_05827 [Loa loa]